MVAHLEKDRLDTVPKTASEALRPQRSSRSYNPVESVQRALSILRCLNEFGVAKVYELSRETGIHKATIVRMLETLMEEGYVTRDECLGGYCVTSQVKALSAGFSGKPRMIEAARDYILELTKEVKWPVGLASIDVGKVTLNFSTSPVSHWSYPFNVIGQTMNLTNSALGRVCMTYCSAEERARLVDEKCRELDYDRDAYTKSHIEPVIARILEKGYALSVPVRPKLRHQFVAVPLKDQGKFVAALGLGFYVSAVPAKEIYKRLVVPLQETAAQIQEVWHIFD